MKEVLDTYRSIKSQTIGEYKEKGSKFIAYAFPMLSEGEFVERLNEVKAEHFKARHHCYAYRLGIEGAIFRANDDGEPSGTAGKPILGQLMSKEISDCGVVVVRYFGGTKLGVSGLIQAYKEAAKEALEQAEIITKVLTSNYLLEFGYDHMGTIMNEVSKLEVSIQNKEFTDLCRMVLEIPLSSEEITIAKFKATLLNISIEYIDEGTLVPFCKIEKIEK